MTLPAQGALAQKLQAALNSRQQRNIRRRLPNPEISIPAGTHQTLPATPASPSLSTPTHNAHADGSGSTNGDTARNAIIDFSSNDYLSLSTSPHLRTHFLSKLASVPPTQPILGSGGSRLLVNGILHANLERRLLRFFGGAEAALLFNSGYDANVGLFSSLPQEGDVALVDEYVHASVHDGLRASRLVRARPRAKGNSDPYYTFSHNSVVSFHQALLSLLRAHPSLKSGHASLFVAVESLYSMDGTFAPLKEIVEILDQELPLGNGYLIVDEAHATGVYGPQGKGRVVELGLESKVLVRLHTFGKALAATGAVIITNTLIRDFLLNYARSLIYTTSLSNTNIIAADASFDMLTDGTSTQLANHLFTLSSHLLTSLYTLLPSVPPHLLSLPSHLSPPSPSPSPSPHAHTGTLPTPLPPIIPLLTSHAHALSAFLLTHYNINARPITWPTVPKGKDRIRVCLHAGNTVREVERLVEGLRRWVGERTAAEEREKERERELAGERDRSGRRDRDRRVQSGGVGRSETGGAGIVAFQSKL
ncbi:hypothetical protein AX16_005182 [Volvariella volvacea WC 439]|nr:hypothetical protein AX16_005182 [Volvariella volvacea WC 439]